jgi:hypothetical protein
VLESRAVNLNKVLTAIVAVGFVGVCAYALLQRTRTTPAQTEPGGAPAAVSGAPADTLTLLLSTSNAKQTAAFSPCSPKSTRTPGRPGA